MNPKEITLEAEKIYGPQTVLYIGLIADKTFPKVLGRCSTSLNVFQGQRMKLLRDISFSETKMVKRICGLDGGTTKVDCVLKKNIIRLGESFNIRYSIDNTESKVSVKHVTVSLFGKSNIKKETYVDKMLKIPSQDFILRKYEGCLKAQTFDKNIDFECFKYNTKLKLFGERAKLVGPEIYENVPINPIFNTIKGDGSYFLNVSFHFAWSKPILIPFPVEILGSKHPEIESIESGSVSETGETSSKAEEDSLEEEESEEDDESHSQPLESEEALVEDDIVIEGKIKSEISESISR